MKTLLVMRHAKSDWGTASSRDHDRPLAERGVKAARRMGKYLCEADAVPELIVSSTAVRALTTAELAVEAGEWGCPIIGAEALYGGGPERVLKIIGATEPGIDRLLIAGHEPTWSMLVSWLIGGGRVHMPTAAVACLDLRRGDWSDLGPDSCELRWLVTPKMLKGK
jgi:phosphohistidine phosphatase